MSAMQWLSDTSANKVVKTYVNGFLDCSGYLLNRVGNVMIGNVDYPGYNINQRSLLVNGRTQMNGNLTINGNISVNSQNIALGFQSGNIINGTQSGLPNGLNSTAVGSYTGMNHTGTNNTFIGSIAGQSGTTSYFSRTGSNNTYVGYNTSANSSGYTNSTAIGTGAIITASNQVVLGTTSETVSIPGPTTAAGLITANGGLTTGTINSSGTTFNLATATATTLNLGSASTTVSIPGKIRLSQNNIVQRRVTTSFNIPSQTATTVQWNTDDNSSQTTGITYSNGVFTNSNSFAITALITGNFTFGTNGNGVSNREIWVIAGSEIISDINMHISGTNQEFGASFGGLAILAANATIQVNLWQASFLNLTPSMARVHLIKILVF